MRTVQSEHDPFLRDFWREESARLYWETDFTEVVESLDGSPRCRWFTGGRTNLSFNALDRHLAEKGEKCAIIHRDYLGQTHRLSYRELWQQVNTLCSMMQSWGVKPGDRVLIALPMTPLVAVAMLACARIGAVHVVLYSAITHEALMQRIAVSQPVLLLHSREQRGRKELPVIAERMAGLRVVGW
ncbi:TPA: AMP-binding protein [Klebsiella pneumoniae]